MRLTPNRVLAALPDAVTCATFAVAWVAPALLGPDRVANLTAVMLMEFIVMHSSGFYAGLAASNAPRARRLGALCVLSAIYATFIVGFALAFASAWPLFAFGWLFAGRFAHLWMRPADSAADTRRAMRHWVASALAYVFGAALTVLLPLPRLGITPAFVASMHLTGSGEWVERPYTVLAFGALYFAVQAWIKYSWTAEAAAADAPAGAAPRTLGTVMARSFGAARKP